MVLLDFWHPPAGATTLIIALWIITRPYHLLIVEAAVAILVLQALIINRLAGIEYPVWAATARLEPAEPVAHKGTEMQVRPLSRLPNRLSLYVRNALSRAGIRHHRKKSGGPQNAKRIP